MKAKEELSALKNEVESLNRKLRELSDDELAQVTGGRGPGPGEAPGRSEPHHPMGPIYH